MVKVVISNMSCFIALVILYVNICGFIGDKNLTGTDNTAVVCCLYS